MNPLMLSVVGGVLMMGLDRFRERRAAKASLAPPRSFSAIEVARFTHPAPGGALRFDPPVAAGIRDKLAEKSVQPVVIDAGPLGRSVQAWQIVPRDPTKLAADTFVANALMGGATVLASLTTALITLPTPTAPMVLLVGGPALAQLAGAGGHFAVFPPPPAPQEPAPPPAPVPQPEPEPKPEPKPEPPAAKKSKANGVAAVAPVAIPDSDPSVPVPGA